MHGMVTALGVALIVAIAGCSGSQSGGDDPVGPPMLGGSCVADPIGWAPATAIEQLHNHSLRSHHAAQCNMTMLAHMAMTSEAGEWPGAHSIDLHGDLLVVSVEYGQAGRGFDLFDVADDASPLLLGSFRSAQASGGDRNVAFSGDGRLVFMANEAGTSSPNAAESAGVRIVDVTDPTAPREVGFSAIQPGGVHTVEPFVVGGVQYVAALNYGVHILELREVQGTLRLVPVGRYATASPQQVVENPDGDDTKLRRSVYGHDTFVTLDELTGQTLLYFAYAYQGARVLDVSNPSAPALVASWVPEGEGVRNYVHDVKAYVRADGRRIMVAEAETFEDENIDYASPVWVIDMTDFSTPKQLARWTNPGGHGSDRLGLSTHFFEWMDGDRLVMAHYHGGVWVLDLTVPESPREAAYFQPAVDTGYDPGPQCCIGWNLASLPMVFAVATDGVDRVYAADLGTGMYVLGVESGAGGYFTS